MFNEKKIKELTKQLAENDKLIQKVAEEVRYSLADGEDRCYMYGSFGFLNNWVKCKEIARTERAEKRKIENLVNEILKERGFKHGANQADTGQPSNAVE